MSARPAYVSSRNHPSLACSKRPKSRFRHQRAYPPAATPAENVPASLQVRAVSRSGGTAIRDSAPSGAAFASSTNAGNDARANPGRSVTGAGRGTNSPAPRRTAAAPAPFME